MKCCAQLQHHLLSLSNEIKARLGRLTRGSSPILIVLSDFYVVGTAASKLQVAGLLVKLLAEVSRLPASPLSTAQAGGSCWDGVLAVNPAAQEYKADGIFKFTPVGGTGKSSSSRTSALCTENFRLLADSWNRDSKARVIHWCLN